MAFHSMQKLMEMDPGSQLVFQVNKESLLESLNLQTSLMSKVFQCYPEVLVILRSHNPNGKVLYIFLADGPRLATDDDFTRIVHIAIPENESPEGLTLMFKNLKDYNPNWVKIRIFLVDPYFQGAEVISNVFPYVEILYSVFHIYKYFQKKIYQENLSEENQLLLLNTLKNSSLSATDENLQKLHTILKHFLKQDKLLLLMLDCLLVSRIWALHRWRTWYMSLLYFQNLESMNHEIDDIFNKSQSLEDSIIVLASHIRDHTLNNGMPNLRVCRPSERSLLFFKQTKPESQEIAGVSSTEPQPAELIQKSLDRICIPAASKLCMNELSAALNAEQVITSDSGKINIQLLENSHLVDWDRQKRCPCHFNQWLQLPCRHIMAVLSFRNEVVQPQMIKKYWQRESTAADPPALVTPEMLEILKSEMGDIPENPLDTDSMANQIMKLLTDCNDEVFQQRYNTLRELADAWIGPYEQVKL